VKPANNKHSSEKRLQKVVKIEPFSTIRRYYRVDRREISYLKFILEAYDGIAVLTTIDPVDGVVFLTVAPGCLADVDQVIKALAKDVMIREIDSETVLRYAKEPF